MSNQKKVFFFVEANTTLFIFSMLSSQSLGQAIEDLDQWTCPFSKLCLTSPKAIHQICQHLDLPSLIKFNSTCQSIHQIIQTNPSECIRQLIYKFPNPHIYHHYLQLESVDNNVFKGFTQVEHLVIHFHPPSMLDVASGRQSLQDYEAESKQVSNDHTIYGVDSTSVSSQPLAFRKNRAYKKANDYQLMKEGNEEEEEEGQEEEEEEENREEVKTGDDAAVATTKEEQRRKTKGKRYTMRKAKVENSMYCRSILNQWNERFENVKKLDIFFFGEYLYKHVICNELDRILPCVRHLSLFKQVPQEFVDYDLSLEDMDKLYCHDGAKVLKACGNAESLTVNFPLRGKLRHVYRLKLNTHEEYQDEPSSYSQNMIALTPKTTLVSTVKLQLSLIKYFSPQMTSLHLHGSCGFQRMDLLWGSLKFCK
ncbi:hypothetical protein RFI_03239 [Reticulomyxa filosa]|uniref:F-box domain-containing protein n=1 Tax=Reticulomyxa filosa TaxID=46433 RepID=X6P6W7_RETFI|nr:hypothetical protein RFI_03239 [Reticulomyxa filosa]|eukprot:ETO33858.1 hypothetical protein RFI_03239 [Reticulomyxa filosa]